MTGQPRPGNDLRRQPTAAERVRTLAESNASACLTIPGSTPWEQTAADAEPGATSAETRAVGPDGSVVMLVGAATPAGRAALQAAEEDLAEVTAVLEITDVAPVSLPQRVRGRAWVAGWLTAVPAEEYAACASLLHGRLADRRRGELLVRLEPGEAFTEDLWGADAVEPDEFAAARADPLHPHEAELLQHLASAHSEQLTTLCAGVTGAEEGCRGGWEQVAPLALDRYGIRLRFWGPDAGFDARFDFEAPVRDVSGLRRAMHHLFATADTGPGAAPDAAG